MANAATFVLVHGAHHGGWCWGPVVSLLEAAGHAVDPVDLPGHGSDRTPLAAVTLRDNASCVADRVASADRPVILVGHSLGGMVITQAAEAIPGRIAALVYVAGLLPRDGQSMRDLPPREPGDPVAGYALIDERAGVCRFAEEGVRDTLYGECSPEVAEWAATRLEPESLAAIRGRVDLSARRGARVPRVYVECWRDQAIRLPRQRAMYRAAGCDLILAIDTDHSPALSRPRALADRLEHVVRRVPTPKSSTSP